MNRKNTQQECEQPALYSDANGRYRQRPVRPAVDKQVVVDTISTEQVAKKLRAMSNTLAIFSQSLERLMEEREHNSMQLLDACRVFAGDQQMLRQLIDSMLPGGGNAATD